MQVGYPSVVSTSQPHDSRATPLSKERQRPETSASSYAEAGVDLDRDEGFVSEIAEITRPTQRPEILSSIGGFAGLFKAPER